MSPDKFVYDDNYFDELLKRVKAIRASEKRSYEELRDLFKNYCWDYDKTSEATKNFFPTFQNKLHLAITGLTAAEIIMERVDCNKNDLGLTTWELAPTGNIRQHDVTVAKNYYTKEELEGLINLVSMYLDYAVHQAEKHKIIYMEKWVEKLDEFLKLNDYEVFNDNEVFKRSISPQKKDANTYAIEEYKKYINS